MVRVWKKVLEVVVQTVAATTFIKDVHFVKTYTCMLLWGVQRKVAYMISKTDWVDNYHIIGSCLQFIVKHMETNEITVVSCQNGLQNH